MWHAMQQRQKFPIFRDARFQILVCSGTVLLLVAFVILRYEGFFAAIRCVLETLRPLLLGLLFALVLNRPYCRFLRDFTTLATRRGHPCSQRRMRCLAIAASVLLALLIVTGIVCILLPQLMDSLLLLTENIGFYAENLSGLLARFSGEQLPRWISQEQLDRALSKLQALLPTLVQAAYGYTAGFLRCLLDVGIGAVFSVYLLADKERLKRQLTSLCTRWMPSTRAQKLASTAKLVCSTFTRFLSSQLTEALILGVLCFLGMTVLRFPYPVLISVIIGITNIVPYVGPILGTIPCMLILLLVQPRLALWFLLFVIVLQQVESNLIFPRIVGRSVGLPPAWVLAAIVIGGGLGGATGMLLGVPVTAVLYAVLFPEESEDESPP